MPILRQSTQKVGGERGKGTMNQISVMESLVKGFSMYYLLLLPILYAAHVIGAEQLGYVGGALYAGIIVGALAVTSRLHAYPKMAILKVALVPLSVATVFLFRPGNPWLLLSAYAFIGFAIGLSASSLNAIAAQFTTQGKRFAILAKISMLTDVFKIAYPFIASAVYAIAGYVGLVWFALLTVLAFALAIIFFSLTHPGVDEGTDAAAVGKSDAPIRRNKPFRFALFLEFLDSFASGQLFIFLPALLFLRGFTIENTLFFQSAVFAGYLCGRWLVSLLALRFDGFKAVGIGEVGMIVTIIFLLVSSTPWILVVLSFLLGLFSRGTSPVIKALVFDRLEPHQMRRGSALYIVGGEGGSAIGQSVFGLLLAWFGVSAPFIVAAICVGIIAVACFWRRDGFSKNLVAA